MIARANMLFAMPTDEPLFARLAASVTNDGEADSAALWLLTMAARAMGDDTALLDRPWSIYDLFIHDIEQVCALWDAFEQSARDAAWPIPVADALPVLARFLCERLPAVWRGSVITRRGGPVTWSVAVADRIDTLVGMFATGLKPNGSKDPLALRRAAKELLQLVICPITPGFCQRMPS